MARITRARQQEMLGSINVIDQFVNGISPGKPWNSIVEFATSPKYCNINLYPRQETILKIIYLETENLNDYDRMVIDEWRRGFADKNNPTGIQEDIYERMDYLKNAGYSHFPKVMSVMGRRAGKGLIGGVIATERIANLVSLDNPQKHYGIDEGHAIQIQNMGTSTSQAKRDLFADISRTASGCSYLQPYITNLTTSRLEISTPSDIRNQAMLLGKVDTETSGSSIIATPLSTTSQTARGGATYFLAFDEFAHILAGTGGPRSSEEIWSAAIPSLDQFGLDGFIYIPSSPYCTAPGTMVLRADLSWCPVEKLSVGDRLVGFDESLDRDNIEPTIVTKSVVLPDVKRYKVSVADGRSVVCTGEHMFVASRSGYECEWIRADQMRAGDQIKSFVEGYPDNDAQGAMTCQFDTVVSVRRVDSGPVIGLETSTHTLITEGMLSHNTKVGQFFNLYQEGSILTPEYMIKHGMDPDIASEIVKETDDPKEAIDRVSAGDPELLILQMPSWEVYRQWDEMPKLVGRPSPPKPIQYAPGTDNPNGIKVIRQERADPERFKVEKRAQFAEVQSAYLDPVLVDRMFRPFNGRKLTQVKSGPIGYEYVAHCDPGKSKANFAVAVAHGEKAQEPDEFGNYWTHAVIDYTHVWKPSDFAAYETEDGSPAKPTINFAVVLDDLKSLLMRFPSMSKLTFDHWQSQTLIDELRRFVKEKKLHTKIDVVDFTEKHNQALMSAFKTELEMDWVHAPVDHYFAEGKCLLEQELKFLSVQGNRVDRQHFGPVTTKDLGDVVQQTSDYILNDQLQSQNKMLLEDATPQLGMQVQEMMGNAQTYNAIPIRRKELRQMVMNNAMADNRGLSPEQNIMAERLSRISRSSAGFGRF